MIPAGYVAKRVVDRPDWLKSEVVIDVYSLSNCISKDFTDYIQHWKHNGYWLFNSPPAISELALDIGIELSGTRLFYYEVYEDEYDEDTNQWHSFFPEPSFFTDAQVPKDKHLEGFDVVTFSGHAGPECSPLSCNSLATVLPVNRHCLFDKFAEAKAAVENGVFRNSEPGPYRIFAVYSVPNCLSNT